MKKLGVFLIILIALNLLAVTFVLAQEGPDVSGQAQQILDTTEKIPKTPDEAKDTGFSLLDEWGKELNKTGFGKVILFFINLPRFLSPLFKILIGIEYTPSWFFVLAFIFWIFIVVLIYRAIKDPFQFKWWIALSVSIIIPAIGAQFGAFEKGVLFILPLFTNKWILFLCLIIIIILFFVYVKLMQKYGKAVQEKLKKEKEQRREQKSETAEKIHDIEIESAGA